jgi:hypothetical protein
MVLAPAVGVTAPPSINCFALMRMRVLYQLHP